MTFSGEPSVRRRLSPRDLRIVQEASGLITDLGNDLDRRLAAEARPAERLRMLRDTTNRIVRTANDAAQAYARVSRALRAELRRPNANVPLATEVRRELTKARRDVLAAIEAARQRYAPDEVSSTSSASEPGPPR